MPPTATLIGLDIGTTTTRAILADCRLAETTLSGRVEMLDLRERYRSPIVFTPFDQGGVHVERVLELVEAWLALAKLPSLPLFGGGALITGLAARGKAAAELAARLRERLGRALIATAEDPCLESWLAFMGNTAELSESHPTRAFINLDIGGGTTNLALGQNGEVLRTSYLLVGARHIELAPGTYRILRLSPEAERLFQELGVEKTPGDELEATEIRALVDTWTRLIEDAVLGQSETLPSPAITFSGGVGELIYSMARGKDASAKTPFGDLGIELAQRILASPILAADLSSMIPEGGGRAVVYGLLRHATELSGQTLFLPRPDALPLHDIPIFALVSLASSDAELANALELVRKNPKGGCFELSLPDTHLGSVRTLARRIAKALENTPLGPEQHLVLLVPQNIGKALGNYITDWGRRKESIIVLDEVRRPGARFLNIGSQRGELVPISFFGMR